MKQSSLDLPRFGSGLGLARVSGLAERLELDLAALGRRSIAIAGSNGKGSVARMLAAALQASGRRTGLFTSPHLFAVNERYEIKGEVVDEDRLRAAEARVGRAVHAYCTDHPAAAVGAFEASFLTACILFAEAGLDDLVFEVGIGGRYDPVRLLKAPLSALVSIDLEHTGLLGDTLEAIALDKLDICPPGGQIIAGRSLERLAPSLETVAALKDIALIWSGRETQIHGFRDSLNGAVFELAAGDTRFVVATNVHGRHQAENAALAFQLLLRRLGNQNDSPRVTAFCQGMSNVTHPGRMEIFSRSVPVLIDVAHTPAAMQSTIDALQDLQAEVSGVALVGVSEDKNYQALLEPIASQFEHFIIGQAYRGLDPEQVAAILQDQNPSAQIQIAADVADAIRRGEAVADQSGLDYMAGLGGLFWAGALRAVLTGHRPDAVAFD